MSKNMTYMTFWVDFLNIKMSKNMTYMTFKLNFGRAANFFFFLTFYTKMSKNMTYMTFLPP